MLRHSSRGFADRFREAVHRQLVGLAKSNDDRGRVKRIVVVLGALIGVVSAACYLFIVDQPITAADMDAASDAIGSLSVGANREP